MEHVSGQCNPAPQVIQQVVVTNFSYFVLAFTKRTLTQNNKTSLALKMQKTLKPKKNFIQVDNSGLCHHQNDGWLSTPHDLPSFELLYILYPSI